MTNSSRSAKSQQHEPIHTAESKEDGFEAPQPRNSSSPTSDGESEIEPESTSPECKTSEARPKKTQWAPIITVTLMLIVDGLGFSTAGAPQMRMYEDIVCRRYFAAQATFNLQQPGHHPPNLTEEMCKAPAVQEAVARLFGWQGFFDGIPGLLLAMYYGALADRRGRRGVLVLSMVGQVLGLAWVLFVCWTELPLELAWLSSVFLIIGGGSTVTGAIATMILADSSPDELRSRVFFYSSAGLIASTVAGSALGSFLMERTSIWTPLLLGLGCTVATACLAALMPETLRRGRRGNTDSRASRTSGRMAVVAEALRHTRAALGLILANQIVFTLIAASLVVDFARHSMSILLQYLSTQYDMSIAEANYLLSFRSAAQLLAFTVIFPALDTYMTRKLRGKARRKDLRLIKLSVVFMAVGFAILAMAPNVPTAITALVAYILGSGYGSFARSLMSSLTQPTMLGTLFTTLSVMESIGTLLMSPAIATVFGWSMRMGGLWPGFLFFVACILCLGVFVVLVVRARGVDEGAEEPATEVPIDEEQVAFLDGESERTD